MKLIHVAFPIQERDGADTIDAARRLGLLLDATLSFHVNRPSDRLRGILAESGNHWVDSRLSSRANRYIADNTAVAEWNPWGYKSGPNSDFFGILDWCEGQGAEWVLLAEADLIPVGHALNDRVRRILAATPTGWVIGAQPSDASKRLLDPRLHDHINGAAFYRVGSPEFGSFRRSVWIPSLLSLLKSFPFFAYDCATATGVWQLLPDELRSSWEENRNRFVATNLMINHSNLVINKAVVTSLLNATEPPIFVHAKTRR